MSLQSATPVLSGELTGPNGEQPATAPDLSPNPLPIRWHGPKPTGVADWVLMVLDRE